MASWRTSNSNNLLCKREYGGAVSSDVTVAQWTSAEEIIHKVKAIVIGAVMNLSQSYHSVGDSIVLERWTTDDPEHLNSS